MTTPVYDPNVPEKPSNSLASTQQPFLTNFGDLFAAFMQNHISLDAATSAGNHNVIQLVEQDSARQTLGGQISVYTKDAPGQTDQIFLKYQGPSGQEFQFTNYQIYSIEPTATQTAYFTFLPGRVLLYFGTVTGNTISLVPVIGNNVISVSCTPALNRFLAIYKPFVRLQITPQGFYNAVSLKYPVVANLLSYYSVMVNV